ncbi:unnamed protein product [Blepharisma stoltei]|uniref:dual-specificity kinase n=1 Tax=Blepharisma stoltei TaxID=1481888 RepID=A0AAU9KLG3_9CILI|nr:unnamed protein product [Blepharisma stoltei]
MSKYKPNLRLNLSLDKKEYKSSGLTKKSSAHSTPRRPLETSNKPIQKSVKNKPNVPILALENFQSEFNSINALLTTSRARSSSKNIASENISLNATSTSKPGNIVNSALLAPKSFNQSPRLPTKASEIASSISKENIDQNFQNFKPPLSAGTVLKNLKNSLTEYEQGEILAYEEIYFIGSIASKLNYSEANYSYDDEKGDYKAKIGDQMHYRYEIVQKIGKGSFGQVFKVYDHKDKQYAALKVIKNKKRFHQQGFVEVKVLKTLKQNDPQNKYNVVHMLESFIFRKHLCIVFELLSTNLYDFMKSNHFHGLSVPLIRKFAFQMLQCLKLSKRLNIIHCDLKPENVLLKQSNRSSIKVIDFGSACFEEQKLYTYIQSRFYRAPEIILGIPYSPAIDMWSLGCILVELYTGYPLFPGENENDQLQCMMELKGLPPYQVLQRASRGKVFFHASGNPILQANSRGKIRYPGTKALSEILKGTELNFQIFIEKCLDWNASTRMTPEEALADPWILDGLSRVQAVSTPRAEIARANSNRALQAHFEPSKYAQSTRHSNLGNFAF